MAETVTAVGDYIPLTLEWKQFAPPSPLYWRATPDDRSLIEVGLHAETVRICSISVILPGADLCLRDDVVPQAPRREERGHPVCDLAPWGSGWIYDEPVPFRIVVDARSASVWFKGVDDAVTDLHSGSVRFHLSAEREIVGFTSAALPPEDVGRIKETLAWIRNTAGPDGLSPGAGVPCHDSGPSTWPDRRTR